MRRTLLAITAVLALPCSVRAGEAARLTWKHEGLASLVRAAEAAKQEKQRLLLGLSGSET